MSKVIAVDFDGTVVTHCFPEVGEDAPHAVEVLKRLQDSGWKIILNTMRGSKQYYNPLIGKLTKVKEDGLQSVLQDAIDWFEAKGIELYGVNKNPSQWSWTDSRKVYAQFYIDDMAIGAPMTKGPDGKECIDWLQVEREILKKSGHDYVED